MTKPKLIDPWWFSHQHQFFMCFNQVLCWKVWRVWSQPLKNLQRTFQIEHRVPSGNSRLSYVKTVLRNKEPFSENQISISFSWRRYVNFKGFKFQNSKWPSFLHFSRNVHQTHNYMTWAESHKEPFGENQISISSFMTEIC